MLEYISCTYFYKGVIIISVNEKIIVRLIIVFVTSLLTLYLLLFAKSFINNNSKETNQELEDMVYVAEPPITLEELVEKTESEYKDVWAKTNVNIREKSNTNSDIVGVYYQSTKLQVKYINKNWAQVKGTKYYVHRDYLSESKVKKEVKENVRNISGRSYSVPNNTIKSYMDYKAITSTGSKQYKLQKIAYTGNYGIRMVNGRYCVALGSYYTTRIGQYVDIELANGNIIHGILADCKADKDTINNNTMHPDGSVVEFVVDTKSLDSTARKMGDCSYISGWNSKVVNIKVYDKIENF